MHDTLQTQPMKDGGAEYRLTLTPLGRAKLRENQLEAELAAAAQALQAALPVGQVKAIGLLEVAAGVRELAAENARLKARGL